MSITTSLRQVAGRRRDLERGWTLIEMLVVLSLIMILASTALVMYRNSVLTAKEATLRSNLMMMREAIDQYYADKGRYPESIDTLVSARYMRAIPKDPITNAADTWEVVEAEAEPGSTQTSAGVYSVKSGSQDTALDGTRYNDW
jgi:general secretion pathway protein G